LEQLIGIDLGTTNCSVTAIDENGKISGIKNKYNEYITPSAVYFGKSKEDLLVGKEAKEKSNSDPANLVLFVKREMGKAKDKVREDVYNREFNPYVYWDKTFAPEEISAFILRQLKEDAERELGTEVKKAVITCPAYFGDSEKNATRNAGIIAGFDVLEVIPEPTAAALSYSAKTDRENERVLVFDLGGGTFDVTILEIKNTPLGKTVETKATDGNHRLGGKDWDDLMISYMLGRFERHYNIDIDYEPKDARLGVYGKLRIAVEKAKVALFKPGVESVPLSMEYGGKVHEEIITRELYANKTRTLTDQCKTYCDNILSAASMTWSDIDTVLMIGNMSNCVTIQDALKQWTGKEINFGLINPKTCVSAGAAIKAHLIEGGKKVAVLEKQENTDTFEQLPEMVAAAEKADREGKRIEVEFNRDIVKSVLPASIGIRVLKRDGSETIFKMLKKNSEYPESFTQAFPMFRDGDQSFTLAVFEGESDVPDECDHLGSAEVYLDGKMHKGDKLSITLSADRNGILQIEAVNQASGIHIKSEIKRATGISEEDVKQASEEIEEFFLG